MGMTAYTIAAQSGPDRYILVPSTDDVKTSRQARILDTKQGKLYPPMYFQTLLAQGYWEEYKGDQDAEALLAGVDIY